MIFVTGTITTGGTAQTVLAAQTTGTGADTNFGDGQFILIQNQSSGSMYFTFDGTIPSATNGLLVAANSTFVWPAHAAVPLGQVSVYAATTGWQFMVARAI